MMKNKTSLSVVVLPGNNSICIHKTIRSLNDSFELLREVGVGCEVVIIDDDYNFEVLEYLKQYKNDKQIRIISNKKDILDELNGKYVGIVVAGDLVSRDWFERAMEACKLFGKKTAIRPETIVKFDNCYRCKIKNQYNERELLQQKRRLCGVYSWSSSCMLMRKTLEMYKKYNKGDGLFRSPYFFDLNLEKLGISNIVVPGTVYFERSRSVKHDHEKEFLFYDKTFDIEEYRYSKNKIGLREQTINRKSKKIIKDIDDGKEVTVRLGEDISKKYPKYLIEKWRQAAKYEPSLYPFDWRLAGTENEDVEKNIEIGITYEKLIEKVVEKPDYLFIVPWLIPGGAEKVLLNYIEALSKIHPKWHFAIITTLKKNNTWESKLPNNAYLLDFGNNSAYLDDTQKDVLFERLLFHIGSRRLDLINSEFGYNWVADNNEFIKNNFDLVVSVFCYDYVNGERREAIFDYADPYLVNIYGAVTKITTDNYANKARIISNCGFSEKKIDVHYQPVDLEMKMKKPSGREKMRILWASRIAYQKCPDLINKIAYSLDPKLFHIDVYGHLEDYDKSFFDGLKNVTYKGGFDGLNSIETDEYDIYLYTSSIDGIPNSLLEAIAAGLPVVAPNVGGISEVINKETGLLVDKYDDVRGFVKALEYARENPDEMYIRTKNAQNLITKRHNWKEFLAVVKRDIK